MIELRHEAGLSAGNTMQLDRGRYEFGPTVDESGGLQSGAPTTVGFELEVLNSNKIVVHPRSIQIKIDGRPIFEPESVELGQIIQSGADHFVIGAPDDFVALARRTQPEIQVQRVSDPELGPSIPYGWLWLGMILLGILLAVYVSQPWILLSIVGLVLAAIAWRGRRRQDRRERDAHSHAIQRANARLVSEVGEARNLVARQCRAAHLSPSGLISGSTEIGSDDDRSQRTGHLNVAVGLGDLSWDPPVPERTGVGWDYKSVVDDHASLTAVPYLLDLEKGPVALVGPSEATAAMARYLAQATGSISGKVLKVVSHDEYSGIAQPQEANDRIGRLLVLARNDDQVPAICVTIVTVNQEGFATVHDQDGKLRATDLIPNGLPDPEALPNRALLRLTGSSKQQSPAKYSDAAASDTSSSDAAASGTSASDTSSSGGSDPGAMTSPAVDPQDADPTAEDQAATTSADQILTMTGPGSDSSSAVHGRMGGVRLYTGDSKTGSKAFLAGIGLELARRRPADQLSITILDDGDRGLIRLRQLPHCVGYAAIDDERGARESLASINAALEEQYDHLQIILASEFPRLIAFLKLSGRQRLADRLLELADQTDQDRLVMVASATTDEPGEIPAEATHRNITSAVSHLRRRAAS